jgi:hypothetical protein
MSSARTIDDLGLETSVRYASDLSALDQTLLNESKGFPPYVQVDVYTPDFYSNTDILFGFGQKNLPFPDFYPPAHYNIQKRQIFTYQLLPSLGTDERLTSHIERIRSVAERDKEKRQKRENEWEEQQQEEEERKESEKLLALLELLQKLDKVLADVSSGRNLYQRG